MKKITQFIKEAIQELRKVAWPTRQQVLRLTVGVILVSAAFALFIGLVDIGLTKGVEFLLTWVAGRSSTSQQSNSTSPIQVQPGDVQVETNTVQ